MRRLLVSIVVTVLAVTGCGDDAQPVTMVDDPGPAGDETRYTATVTVLESPDHGPQLCGAVAESYPPQCGGPDIVGWDWADVEGEEQAAGTTWGTWSVVGTWDGEQLTLTEPPRPPEGRPADVPTDFTSPCAPPEGGWAVVDPATATEEGQQAAIGYARRQPEFAGVWVDHSINPAQDEPIDGLEDELALNDPKKLVLNLRFTGDLARHEAAVREVWGGSLCVSEADRSLRELERIRGEVEAEIGVTTFSSLDERRGVVEFGVWVVDGDLQRDLDERYGTGVVQLDGLLVPVP